MISQEKLAQEYIRVINSYYPTVSPLLHHCLVKILKLNVDRTNKYSYYLGIYYPERLGPSLLEQQDIFREASENMGLIEVVFINANHLVRDPHSTIKQQDLRFWLELSWIANQAN